MSYHKVNDSIIVQKYIDEGLRERQSYHLSALEKDYIDNKTFLLGTDKFGRDIFKPVNCRHKG